MFLRVEHLTSHWQRGRGLAPQGEWRHMPAHCSLHITPAWEALEKREGFARILEVAGKQPLDSNFINQGVLESQSPTAGWVSVCGWWSVCRQWEHRPEPKPSGWGWGTSCSSSHLPVFARSMIKTLTLKNIFLLRQLGYFISQEKILVSIPGSKPETKDGVQ